MKNLIKEVDELLDDETYVETTEKFHNKKKKQKLKEEQKHKNNKNEES